MFEGLEGRLQRELQALAPEKTRGEGRVDGLAETRVKVTIRLWPI